MRIGVVGLGKVGLPLALVLRHYGKHQVIGYDIAARDAQERMEAVDDIDLHPEAELRDLLRADPVPLAPDIDRLVQHSDVIVVIVPTPHPDGWDGSSPMPQLARDFDYQPLFTAISMVYGSAFKQGRAVTIVVASTVTPGTMDRITATFPKREVAQFAYNPVLISLGTVATDLMTPDLIMIGTDAGGPGEVERMWRPVVNTCPVMTASFLEVELAKLALNGYASMRINYANQLQRLCDRLGANVDAVAEMMSRSSLLLPARFMQAGLPDAGACRPRDALALAWLSEELGDRGGIFLGLTVNRHEHLAWLADKIARLSDGEYPIVMFGTAYKPEVPYEDGSSAIYLAGLVEQLTTREVIRFDPVVRPSSSDADLPDRPALFVLGTAHRDFVQLLVQVAKPGSVVFDPWGRIPDGCLTPTLRVVQPGRATR